jgi:hypothetical protein
MKLLGLTAAAAALLASPAFAAAPGDLDAAARVFFAKNGVNGAVEFMDPAAGVKRALKLPAAPSSVYQASTYYILSYEATDPKANKVDLDVFVKGEAGKREVGMVYVSARPVVSDMAAKGKIQKVQ